MISIFTDLKVPYMISDKSLLLMWLKCNTGNQTISFQIYLPWWRKYTKHLDTKRFGDIEGEELICFPMYTKEIIAWLDCGLLTIFITAI